MNLDESGYFWTNRWRDRRAGVIRGGLAATAHRAARHTAAMASGPPQNDSVNAADAAAAIAAVRYRELIFWMFQAVYWSWCGAALYALGLVYQPDRGSSFLSVASRMVIGVLASSCIHWVQRSRPVQRLGWKMQWVVAATSTLVMLIFWLLMISDQVLGAILAAEGPQYYFPLFCRLFVTVVWLAVYLGLDALQRAQEAERRIRGSELRAARAEALARSNELRHLEAQMNPHFLFNALNCIVAASRDHDAVEKVTQDLADYLRFALEPSQPLEPLSRELAALEKYLAVQQSRFGADLVCRISCEPEARSVPVPPMMIQPLLENAFHYGRQTSPMPLHVSVAASVREGQLCVIVANSGSWVTPDPARSIGSGIQTLRKRLEILLGPAATVDVVREQGWVKIVIRLPAGGVPVDQAIPTVINS